MAAFITDLRYGLRMFRRNPALTAIVAFTLALGIGANSAIFSIVDAILLRPLAVSHPAELVKVNAGHKERFNEYSSYPDYLDFKRQTKTLAGLTAFGNRGASIGLDGAPLLISVCVVAPNYFPMLGIKAALGRTFGEESADPNNPLVAVVSYRFWQRRLGGDPNASGRVVRLNKQVCTIVGILSPDFRGTAPGDNPDLWMPIGVWNQINGEDQSDRSSRWLELLGRLNRGVSLTQAQAEMEILHRQLAQSHPETNRNTRVSVIPESEARSSWAHVMGMILLAVAGLVLLIACINISNLLLTHAEGRRSEIATRLALGAGPFRIVRQVMSESLLLALSGGALALLLAGWIIHLLPGLMTSSIFSADLDIRLDGRVLSFTLLVSLAAVFGFGIVPAFRATRFDLMATLKQQSAASSRRVRGWSLGNVLVISQLALSIMLLIGAGLLARTFWNIRRLDPGFHPENRLLFWMVPAAMGCSEDQTGVFYRTLLDRVAAIPGVRRASLVQRPPLYPTEGGQRYRVTIPGIEIPAGTEPLRIKYTVVWPNYFEVMGITIRRGRTFTGLETGTGQGSILINDAMARKYWRNEDPIGKHVQVRGKDCEIIGVVQDGKYVSLREEPEPYMYLAIPQFPSSDMTLLVHTDVEPHTLIGIIERNLRNLAGDLPAPEISTMEEQMQLACQGERMAAILVGCLSGLAACLATVGLYGLISFSVKCRTREIGIRMALGAPAPAVLRMILHDGLILIVAGSATGLLAATFLTRFLASQLFGVAAIDPATYALVTLLLVTVALLSCFFPARRAAGVNPMVVLRYE